MLLAWAAHAGAVIIPKAATASHLQENMLPFSSAALRAEDMAALGALEQDRHFYWNPDLVL